MIGVILWLHVPLPACCPQGASTECAGRKVVGKPVNCATKAVCVPGTPVSGNGIVY